MVWEVAAKIFAWLDRSGAVMRSNKKDHNLNQIGLISNAEKISGTFKKKSVFIIRVIVLSCQSYSPWLVQPCKILWPQFLLQFSATFHETFEILISYLKYIVDYFFSRFLLEPFLPELQPLLCPQSKSCGHRSSFSL